MRKIRGKIRLPREHREVRCTKGRSDRRDRPGVQLGCQHEAQRMIHGPNTFRRCRLFEKKTHQRTRLSRQRRYGVFFEVRADLAWVGMYGGGCCSPAIAHQTPT